MPACSVPPVWRYAYVTVRPVMMVVNVEPDAIVGMLSSGRDEVIPCAIVSVFTNLSVSPQPTVTVCGPGPVGPSATVKPPERAKPAKASAATSAAPTTSRLHGRRDTRSPAPLLFREM